MKKFLIMLAVLLVCVGCGTIKYVDVPTVQRDTVRIVDIQHDSVYVSEGYKEVVRNDTVYLDRIRYEYRYKLKTDTLYKVQVDSVAYPVEVQVDVPYVPKHVEWMAVLGIVAVLLFVLKVVLRFVKL